jgi:ATP-binding cassette subfamily C protein/ATP-binding cassette subfamily C protein EexD
MALDPRALAGETAPGATPLARAVAACRGQFVAVGVFSGVVNVLQLTVSIYMMTVFDRVFATRSLDTLLYLTLIALAALALLALLEGARSRVMQRVGAWVEESVAPEGFARAVESQLRGRPYRMEALRDLGACRGYMGSPGALAVYDVPWVPVFLLVIFLLHPVLGAVALTGAALLLGLALANEFATSKVLREANSAAMASQRRAESIVRNAEVIDSMGMLPAVMARWRSGMAEVSAPLNRAMDRAAPLLALTKFSRLAVQVAILGIGAWLVLRQDLTAGAAIAGSIIMGRALAPVEQLVGGWRGLVQARQSWKRLQAFLALPRIRPPGIALPEPRGRLAAERVTFGFPGSSVATVKAVSFALDPGESLAVIGPSAAGKTTLIRMLTGTLQPLSGSVRLDGADVYTWRREDFGRHMGYLPQDVELFDGTVLDNIARMAQAPAEAVFDAARLAGAHEMILRLPKGYETGIGEGGQHLSGGQRQQIGLARAMFGKPKLVVLDEPNSNLDGDAEAALLGALQELRRRGTTVVLVSHRPVLVQGVEKVLLLRDGAVETFGPRVEVLKKFMKPARATAIPSPPGPAEGREATA